MRVVVVGTTRRGFLTLRAVDAAWDPLSISQGGPWTATAFVQQSARLEDSRFVGTVGDSLGRDGDKEGRRV